LPDELTLTFRNDHRIPEDKLMKFFEVVYVVLELIKKLSSLLRGYRVIIKPKDAQYNIALPANVKPEWRLPTVRIPLDYGIKYYN
jgi:hypothetical protein